LGVRLAERATPTQRKNELVGKMTRSDLVLVTILGQTERRSALFESRLARTTPRLPREWTTSPSAKSRMSPVYLW
jgi:hypothetical protein